MQNDVMQNDVMQNDVLPTLSIFIEPKLLKVLKSNVWNEEPIASKLVVDNIPYKIGITYRGDLTRKFRKNRIELTLANTTRYLKDVNFTLMLNIVIPH
ncbi:hypothetical protein ACFQDF_12505 [Ectobacillus funiculus]